MSEQTNSRIALNFRITGAACPSSCIFQWRGQATGLLDIGQRRPNRPVPVDVPQGNLVSMLVSIDTSTDAHIIRYPEQATLIPEADMTDLNRRYGMNPPHSEVVDACRHIAPCDVLDMGCSTGRNALYLSQLGFNVIAVDNNANAIRMLQSIVAQEGITNIAPRVYDINAAGLDAEYGFIACTVTLMFLDPDRVAAVLADMQAHTLPDGCNLIVCAMDTAAHPCPINFPFTLHEGQLRAIYQGWELLKYNEDLGTMHNGAQLQFATMLARKPG